MQQKLRLPRRQKIEQGFLTFALAPMSLLNDLTNVATNSGSFSELAQTAKKLISGGISPKSSQAKALVEVVEKMIPDNKNAVDLIQKIDDLIPDAIQAQFGFTPEVMKFIKEALGGSSVPTKTVS